MFIYKSCSISLAVRLPSETGFPTIILNISLIRVHVWMEAGGVRQWFGVVYLGGDHQMERVIVELDDVNDNDIAGKVLKGCGWEVSGNGEQLVVLVPENEDPEQQANAALTRAGVKAHVFLAEEI